MKVLTMLLTVILLGFGAAGCEDDHPHGEETHTHAEGEAHADDHAHEGDEEHGHAHEGEDEHGHAHEEALPPPAEPDPQ